MPQETDHTQQPTNQLTTMVQFKHQFDEYAIYSNVHTTCSLSWIYRQLLLFPLRRLGWSATSVRTLYEKLYSTRIIPQQFSTGISRFRRALCNFPYNKNY